MPALSFPPSPAVNDLFTASGKTWRWNGTFWELVLSGPQIADGSVSTAKLADGAITAAKIADGTIVAAEIANNAITTDKIAAGAVTAAKLGNDIQLTPPDGSITTAKVAANAITQAKLATALSAVTVTTSANRDTAVPSPFTGQLVFLTDTKKMQVWDGSLWLNITLAPPEPPTSLSATALSTTSISVSFTAGADNGSVIANYKYALSTNGGSTYGAFTALDPADATSPITISGLTVATTYFIKLKTVNGMGDSVESSATSVTTLATPDAPTNLSASAGATTVDISFTAGADNGYAITNYQYALSTNGGSTYGSFTALNPADASSPITITGLTATTAYYAKLKAVNSGGAGPESSAVSFTTVAGIEYLVVAGGGGGGAHQAGGGGAGGYRSSVSGDNSGGGASAETVFSASLATNYTVTVGGGGGGGSGLSNARGTVGNNSVFGTITSTGGGGGGGYYNVSGGGTGGTGGSGGGGGSGSAGGSQTAAAGTPNQGFAGGTAYTNSPHGGGGGGGAGAVGANAGSGYTGGNGGAGVSSSVTGTPTTLAGGGGGSSHNNSAGTGGSGGGGQGGGGNSSGSAGTGNLGGGGGGGANEGYGGGAGGSGVVILRYPSARTITVGAGLTTSHVNETIAGGYKYTRFTQGSGNVSWS